MSTATAAAATSAICPFVGVCGHGKVSKTVLEVSGKMENEEGKECWEIRRTFNSFVFYPV